jgi:hypothetical protein
MRAMRLATMALLALAAVPALLPTPPARAYEMPYDPYPWCARYTGRGGGASNCGFLTLEQCQATVSGIGGFCERNQFYNPGPARRHKRRQH